MWRSTKLVALDRPENAPFWWLLHRFTECQATKGSKAMSSQRPVLNE